MISRTGDNVTDDLVRCVCARGIGTGAGRWNVDVDVDVEISSGKQVGDSNCLPHPKSRVIQIYNPRTYFDSWNLFMLALYNHFLYQVY